MSSAFASGKLMLAATIFSTLTSFSHAVEQGGAGANFAAVPTFHSVGLYWSPVGSGDKIVARVEYRIKGQEQWKQALDLWYDGRALAGRPAEYRGSIVNLTPGSEYEVKLALSTGATETHPFSTWSETFPIARTVEVPASSSKILEISNVHGSPQGYVLYAPGQGATATIDVNNAADCNVRVTNCSYLIIRGLTLTGAKTHGIQLGGDDDNVHDIVIEENDINNWGNADETGFGHPQDSAVYSNSTKLQRIVVQRNRLHDPRSNSNSWKEKHKTFHPEGPQGISFMRGLGQYVIRYNEITGNPTHHFNDSMGAYHNFSYDGFPNRDSDVYGNYIAYVWDDGLEIEGADMNVRIWGNYITETYHGIATAAVSMGPLYIFRNVANVSRTGPNHSYGQGFLKAGGNTSKNGYFGDGRVYLLNNTLLVLSDNKSQIKGAIGDSGDRTIRNYITRNNIFATADADKSFTIHDTNQSETNSFDYDLYNGKIQAVAGSESHGIVGVPTYIKDVGLDPKKMTGNFALDPKSLGFDKGAVMANFTDGFTGAAPDVGAHEAGTPPMQFGVKAGR